MLDDLDYIKRVDRSDMLSLAEKIADDIKNAVEIADRLKIEPFMAERIMITGMGGSAIGGEILADYLSDRVKTPIIVSRDYFLPASADERTLLFALSYSGNTEETLSALNDGIRKKCRIISISSDGLLREIATAKGIQFLEIPKGMPPRSALPYLLFPMLVILEKLNLVDARKEIGDAVTFLREQGRAFFSDVKIEDNIAKSIAIKLRGTIPVVYAHSYLSSMAKRWQTQFNENSKVLAWHGTFPEMNHNEIVAWNEQDSMHTLMLLRSDDEFPRTRKRIELTKRFLSRKRLMDVWIKGHTRLERICYALQLGDFVSIYLAVLNGIDPYPVDIIERLKEEMKG